MEKVSLVEHKGYRLIYRDAGTRQELTLVIQPSSEGRSVRLVWLEGSKTKKAFKSILNVSKAIAGMDLIMSSSDTKVFSVREDLGPILAAYLLLARRSPKPESWIWFLEETLEGKLSGIGDILTSFLDLTIRLSPLVDKENSSEISPVALDIVSAGLKEMALRIKTKINS